MATPHKQDSQKENKSFQEFGGVNTQAARQDIKDEEFAWLENAMPIGFGNLKTVPYQSAILATIPATAYYMQAANIGGADYQFMFCTDGSAYQVALAGYAVTTIGPAGTFNGSGTQFAQWKNERIVIIDPTKGYFSWDGVTLVTINGLVQTVTVTFSGSGYTTRPTVNFGGPGSGASAQAVMGAVAAVVATGGTGYFVGDILSLVGGTGTAAQFRVSAIGTGGAVTGFSIQSPGDYTANAASPVAVTGGFGTGATFTVTWGISSITVLAGGTGYSTTPAVTFSGGNASATANVSVAPSGGNCIASYGGRVWISAARTIVYSAPNSYNDFSTGNAGGNFIFTDETLHNNINQLVSANNFLYVVGDSSFNVISDVRVSAGLTIFSNTNVSASIGSVFPQSIIPYYRSLWFANRFGIFALYGSTTQKASDPLDGVYQLLNLGIPITGAQFVLYNILCAAFLVRYLDPFLGSRPLLCIYFNKKWFFCSQGPALTLIAGANPLGVPTLYGTDGTNLYQLFADITSKVSLNLKSKLWDMGDPLRVKQVLKSGLEAVVNTTQYVSAQFNIDTEYGSQSVNTDFGLYSTWINNSASVVTWQNNSLATVSWVALAGNQYTFSKFDISVFGNYIGVSFSATNSRSVYTAFHIQYEERAVWATPGT